MKRIILIMAVLIGAAGCQTYDIGEILLQRDDISLTVRGEEQLKYIAETFQIGYNAELNEFRVFDDDMANWFVLKCSSRPDTEGQEVTADIRWTTPNTTKTKKSLTFRVEKTDSEGHIWLWCNNEAIGVVVQEL